MANGRKVALWVGIGCSIFIVAAAAIVGSILLVAFGAIRDSDPYKEAMRRAQRDPRVIAVLGAPVEAGWFTGGNINVTSEDDGTADLDLRLRGPKGKATMRVIGTKSRGRWYYQQIVVTPENAAGIDLMLPGESTSTAPPAG